MLAFAVWLWFVPQVVAFSDVEGFCLLSSNPPYL